VLVSLNNVPVYQTNIQSVLNIQHGLYHCSRASSCYSLPHLATNFHCNIALAVAIH